MFLTKCSFVKPLQTRSISVYDPEIIFKGENIKKTMTKFLNTKPIRLQPNIPAKKAAVLIPLCVVNQKVSLLYTLRASNLKNHRGQVSFPGGMQDLSDKNLINTALRETEEELGIPQKNVYVWGSGNLIITKEDTCVQPIVGHLKDALNLKDLSINLQEVEEVFAVPLEDLCDENKIGYTQFKGAYSTPVFLGGRRRIWGLTALITNLFLKSLLPTKIYVHRVKYIQLDQTKSRYFNRLQ